MKFVFTFALILTMLLALASLSTANAPANLVPTPGDTQPGVSAPQGGNGPASAVQSQPTAQSTAVPQKTADGWDVLAPGISYQEFHLDGPNNVYVARMDTSGTYSNTIETSLGNGKILPDWTSIPAQFQYYDGAINTWGRNIDKSHPWGMTNKVVVAINGSYYDKKVYKYQALSGVIASGWYAKRIDPGTVAPSFAWRYNRSAFISDCAMNLSHDQLLKFRDGTSMQIDGVNVDRGANQLILYTPQYDNSTHTGPDGVEIQVAMTSPTIPNQSYQEITGTVRSSPSPGPTLIPFDSIVLSASGDKATELTSKISQGTVVGIAQEITDLDFNNNCETTSGIDWSKTYASISGDFHFLNQGVINPYSNNGGATVLAPRTAVAYNSNYIYFIVVDGRTKQSIGWNIKQLGLFTRDTLGATDGMAEDSGGSSIIVVNGVIRNHPSDCRLIFLPMINNQSGGTSSLAAPSAPSATTVNPAFYTNCIRSVTNGLLMVQSNPKQMSDRGYTDGTSLVTESNANIRLGPGTNYATVSSDFLPAGSSVTIQADPNGLNGVLAKGFHWWKVSTTIGTGWIAEEGNLP